MEKMQYLKKWLTIRHLRRLRQGWSDDRVKKILKGIFWAGVGIGALFLFWFLFLFLPSLPDVGSIENLTAAQASEIFDREGNLLYRIHGDENRENVPLGDISEDAIHAVMSIEDDQFYQHHGIDVPGIIKAVCAEFGLCPARGGSTITQQFIKNAFLSPERTYSRKLREMVLALELEMKFSKDQILEMYLNRIPYGSNIYGIERASNVFFGKSAKDLTLAEAATLASIPKAPTFYSPYGNNKYASTSIDRETIFKEGIESEQDLVDFNSKLLNKGLLGKTYFFPEEELDPADLIDEDGGVIEPQSLGVKGRSIYLKGRADFVLARMSELGYINEIQLEQAVKEAEGIEFNEFREEIKAPHFVMYVKSYLEEKYGRDQVEQGGLRVTTTIDPLMQEVAEKAVAEFAEQNLNRYDASNASLVALNPDNGQVMAMVGSVDFWNDEIDGKVNVALRPRLPGSSFKPIVYAAAFLQGYAPSTILYDVRTKFGAWYEPENYDGEYRGPVTMKKALAHSLNVPAVKAGYLAGIPNVLDLARKMGIQLNQQDDWYGLSLALGAGEARLIDMVGAYSVFASGGYKMDPISIIKIEDRNGNILEEYESPINKELILDPQVAYLVNRSLSDVEARPEGWWRQQLSIPNQINAAKTGTSNKKIDDENYPFDTWTVGYTRRLAAGVWAGNNDGRHLGLKASGLDTAGRIWNRFMNEVTKEMPKEDFDKPKGIRYVSISEKTGLLPSEFTPDDVIKTEEFASFSVPTKYDEAYHFVEIDKVSGLLATEWTPEAAIEKKAFFEHHSILPDNPNWEEAVRQWAQDNNQDEKVPTEYSQVHNPETIEDRPELVIQNPAQQAIISPPNVGVLVEVDSKVGIEYVEYFFDDELVYTAQDSPFRGVIPVSKNLKMGSEHVIKAIAYDKLYRSTQSSVSVEIGKDTRPPHISFAYPGDGVRVPVNSALSVGFEAWDNEGDVKKIEVYLEGKLKETLTNSPFSYSFLTPDKSGDYQLKAIASDYADNQSSTILNFTLTEDQATYSESTILRPKDNTSFSQGESVLIQVGLSEEVRQNLASIEVQARKDKGRPLVIKSWKNEGGGAVAAEHSFVWPAAEVGRYELTLKLELTDGRNRFTQRVPIVVR